MPEPPKRPDPAPSKPTASGGTSNPTNSGSVSSTNKPGNMNASGMSSGEMKPGGGSTHGTGTNKNENPPEVYGPPVPPRNIFFVYNAKKGFQEQADFIEKKMYRDQLNKFIYVTEVEEFVNEWNSLVDTRINDILLFLHGGAGKLYFANEGVLKYDDFSQLEKLRIEGRAYLLACNGGTEYEGTTVAWKFSYLLHGKRVRAVVDGSVYYRDWYQLFDRWPLTKEKEAYWADFYYVRGLTSRRKLQLESVFWGRMPWPV